MILPSHEDMARVTRLEVLMLDNNNLPLLPDYWLPRLAVLDLSGNRLRKVRYLSFEAFVCQTMVEHLGTFPVQTL